MPAGDHERESDPGLEVLTGLAERVLGRAGARVVWRRLPHDHETPGARRFEYEAAGGRLVVRGSDVLGAAVGLHEYLKAVVGRRVCWDTVLPLPLSSLPDVELTSGDARVGDVYYMNFCTFSYTTAFWDWDRWQREIDWMALHGVTLPLAAVGHEAVLATVYGELGLREQDVLEFLGGPGYLPFQFMGCLDGWAGPMPVHWLREREALGRRIIGRQLDFGMTPVLPAFTGHVPSALAGEGTSERSWWGFTTSLLAPGDPRFRSITQRVVEVQREIFGTAHHYAADPFIEMRPPSDDPNYLNDLAGALVAGLRAGDPDAVWVMQAWTFAYLDYWTDDRVAAFLDSVPDDAMLVLDLWGEHSPQWRRFAGFRGKPWVWCALHNFGGRSDLYGNVQTTREEFEAALRAPSPPVGVGLAMEATEQNPVVYELVLDLARGPISDVAAWSGRFAAQRYGLEDRRSALAWDRLIDTVYRAPADRLIPDATRGCLTLRPTIALALDEQAVQALIDSARWYDPSDLFDAWRDLLDVATARTELLPAELGHDVVSVAGTAMSRACDRLLLDVVTAWRRSGDEFVVAGRRFLSALDDVDALLSIRPELRLATWEAAAASCAEADADRRTLLDNARRIISVWDSAEKEALTDYSARLWSGLVRGLYRERWRVWLGELTAARVGARAPDEAVLTDRIDEVTEAFIAGTAPRSIRSAGEPLAELRRLLDFYAPVRSPDR